jgi:hypothetical protein
MTIDAIFICFVEDCDINNGVDRPYFMSKGLMVNKTFSIIIISCFYTSMRDVDKFFKTLAKLASSSVSSLAKSENNWPKK